jgi:hypothetical protein
MKIRWWAATVAVSALIWVVVIGTIVHFWN